MSADHESTADGDAILDWNSTPRFLGYVGFVDGSIKVLPHGICARNKGLLGVGGDGDLNRHEMVVVAHG